MTNQKSILIITTYYPPDTTIAAVRPYMLAKYLSKMGYKVTVLRSGEIIGKADVGNLPELDEVKVLSYLGEESSAERFKRGEVIEFKLNKKKSRISFLPERLRKVISKTYRAAYSPVEYSKKLKRTEYKYDIQRKFLDDLKLRGESFDVVFATVGELENAYAGEYAAKLFGCRYILDFRDLIAQRVVHNYFEYLKLLQLQKKAVEAADVVTTVSESMTSELAKRHFGKKILTVYNGYDSSITIDKNNRTDKKLIFCYTGQLYFGLRDASPLFRAVSELKKDGRIDPANIEFVYAGADTDVLIKQAAKHQTEEIIKDCGYIGRKEVQNIQNNSDVFVVLSWNTRTAHGILTGKLYEGIRCEKPILSLVSGNEANSELKIMNEKYNYGFCFEEANSSEDYTALKEWIFKIYQSKINGEKITSYAKPDFFTDFRYDKITEKLDLIISDLINGEDYAE